MRRWLEGVQQRHRWLRFFGPLWRLSEIADNILGYWERMPVGVKRLLSWFGRAMIAAFSYSAGTGFAFLALVLNLIGDNPVLFFAVALLIGTAVWFVIEATMYRRRQAAAGTRIVAIPTVMPGKGEATTVGPPTFTPEVREVGGRVSSDGFEWVLDGWLEENVMNLRPLCSTHQVQILFKDNSGNVERMSSAKNLAEGRLYCPAGRADDAHSVDLAESKTWASAVQLAATRMQYVLERGRNRNG